MAINNHSSDDRIVEERDDLGDNGSKSLQVACY
jgi:hypothetical protein